MALAITYLDAAYWSGGATSPTLASVTLNTGDLLIALCLQDQPFDNQAVTSATWGANGLSQAIEKLGDTGGSFDWIAGAAYIYQVSSGATSTITFNLAGSAARGVIVALKATGFDTSTPVGATDSTQVTSAAASLTLAGTSGDAAIYGVATDYQATDRWLEGNNSITEDYTSDPRPGNIGRAKFAVGHKAFSTTSCTLGFTSRGVDSSPVDVTIDQLAIGLVIKAASGGGGGASVSSSGTLGTATSGATLKSRAGITSARTLGTLTSAATAGGPRVVTAAQTLGQMGSVASMLLIDPALANNTLGQMTSAAVVDAIAGITSTKTLGALTSVAGINVNTASANQTLGALASSAVVDGVTSISSAKTLGALSAAAFIAPSSYITGSGTLDAMVSRAVIAHGHVMRPTWTRRPSNATTWTRRV